MKQYSVVIIGMGRMGRTRLKAMEKHGGYIVKAVCDSNAANFDGYTVPCYTDWKECIDQEKPDAVIVCTVNSVIPDVVCYSIEQGHHVFAEKPPGKTLKDALRMKETYLANDKVVLKYGFNHRYHNSVIEAKSLIDSGFLGNIVAIRGVYGKAGDLEKNEWRNKVDVSGGGILLDQGIHMLDLIRYFAGDFEEVSGFTEHLVWRDAAGEDTAFATLRRGNEVVATLHSSAIQWKHKFDMDIVLTDGYIALNGL